MFHGKPRKRTTKTTSYSVRSVLSYSCFENKNDFINIDRILNKFFRKLFGCCAVNASKTTSEYDYSASWNFHYSAYFKHCSSLRVKRCPNHLRWNHVGIDSRLALALIGRHQVVSSASTPAKAINSLVSALWTVSKNFVNGFCANANVTRTKICWETKAASWLAKDWNAGSPTSCSPLSRAL